MTDTYRTVPDIDPMHHTGNSYNLHSYLSRDGQWSLDACESSVRDDSGEFLKRWGLELQWLSPSKWETVTTRRYRPRVWHYPIPDDVATRLAREMLRRSVGQ